MISDTSALSTDAQRSLPHASTLLACKAALSDEASIWRTPGHAAVLRRCSERSLAQPGAETCSMASIIIFSASPLKMLHEGRNC